MIAGSQLPRLSPDVILVDVPDGSARLLDLDGQFHALSDVAAMMLRETLNHGQDQAAKTIAERYGVEVAAVAADVHAFINDLKDKGLIVEAGQNVRRRKAGLLARCVMSTLLRLNRWLRPTQAGKVSGMLTLASLCCRWLGWARTVELWQTAFPAAQRVTDDAAAQAAAKKIDEVVRGALAKLTIGTACKERGLTSWALARRAGLAATMFVGVTLYPLNAHCWTTVGDMPLADEVARCQQYEPVIRYA
ncbi:MAG TPA: lasso peptide biosynthesis B2 protein [Gemmataceae bacterium]|nr:lasso peptide biosynthesis B2 protein [Gemmataceae bacterium]